MQWNFKKKQLTMLDTNIEHDQTLQVSTKSYSDAVLVT